MSTGGTGCADGDAQERGLIPACPRRPRHQRQPGQAGCWVCSRRAAEPVAVLTRGLAGARWRQGIGTGWTRFPGARLRYTRADGTRTWYWRDHRLRLHRYDRVRPSPGTRGLLRETGHDPIAIIGGSPSRPGSQPPPQFLTMQLPVRARPALRSHGYEGPGKFADCPSRPQTCQRGLARAAPAELSIFPC